jgi:hypothetical protein
MRVGRVLLLVTRPSHLTREEADAWSREGVGRVATSPLVEEARLTWLRAASERHSRPRDLLVGLHLRDGAQAGDCLAEPRCAELLRDLRQLGMRPVVLAREGTGEAR